MKKMSVESMQAVKGGVGDGWFSVSTTRNYSGGVQWDMNALDGGTIRYEYEPPEKKTSTFSVGLSWDLSKGQLDIPGVTAGSIDTGVTRTYYPPTQDGSYQAYRDGERFFY